MLHMHEQPHILPLDTTTHTRVVTRAYCQMCAPCLRMLVVASSRGCTSCLAASFPCNQETPHRSLFGSLLNWYVVLGMTHSTCALQYSPPLAVQLGAVVHKEVGPEVTHVVAKKAGTDKVMWAEQNGRSVVHLNWLIFSGMPCFFRMLTSAHVVVVYSMLQCTTTKGGCGHGDQKETTPSSLWWCLQLQRRPRTMAQRTILQQKTSAHSPAAAKTRTYP